MRLRDAYYLGRDTARASENYGRIFDAAMDETNYETFGAMSLKLASLSNKISTNSQQVERGGRLERLAYDVGARKGKLGFLAHILRG